MKTSFLAAIAAAAASLFVAGSALALPTGAEVADGGWARIGESVFKAGDRVELGQAAPGKAFLAGQSVRLGQPVAGAAYLAGSSIVIDQPVAGDLFVAGGTVRIESEVAGDVFVFAGNLEISGRIGGDLVAAASEAEIRDSAVIAGETVLAGGFARFAGAAEQDLWLAADRVQFAGPVAGTAQIKTSELEIQPGARVGATLDYSARREAALPAGFVGAVNFTQVERGHAAEETREAAGGSGFWWLMMAVTAGLISLGLGSATATAGQAARQFGGWSLLVGLAFLLVPVLAAVLAFTLVGAWLAVLLLAIWALHILFAFPFMAFTVGSLLLRPTKTDGWKRRVVIPFVGAALLFIVSWLPVVGGIGIGVAYLHALGSTIVAKALLYKQMKKAKLV